VLILIIVKQKIIINIQEIIIKIQEIIINILVIMTILDNQDNDQHQ